MNYLSVSKPILKIFKLKVLQICKTFILRNFYFIIDQYDLCQMIDTKYRARANILKMCKRYVGQADFHTNSKEIFVAPSRHSARFPTKIPQELVISNHFPFHIRLHIFNILALALY